jgi:hypothetical protein
MAKVVMPLLGAEAHGTVGKAVTYRARPGMTTAGRYKKQRDAESAAQLAQRAKFEGAVAAWPQVCEAARVVLTELAAARHLNAWNWFLRLWLRDALPAGEVGDVYVGDFRVIG